jgi:MFS superfamily sulfate permease-like transporter
MIVPALSVSTRQDVDLSKEIIGHGISNMISGLFGSTQVKHIDVELSRVFKLVAVYSLWR